MMERVLTAEETSYLREFESNLRGDYNKLPMRVPETLAEAMNAALVRDELVRAIDRGEWPYKTYETFKTPTPAEIEPRTRYEINLSASIANWYWLPIWGGVANVKQFCWLCFIVSVGWYQ